MFIGRDYAQFKGEANSPRNPPRKSSVIFIASSATGVCSHLIRRSHVADVNSQSRVTPRAMLSRWSGTWCRTRLHEQEITVASTWHLDKGYLEQRARLFYKIARGESGKTQLPSLFLIISTRRAPANILITQNNIILFLADILLHVTLRGFL